MKERTFGTCYAVWHDNGEQYDCHHSQSLLFCMSAEEAQEIVDELNAWREVCREGLPPRGDHDKDWREAERVDRIYEKALDKKEFPPCPMGLELETPPDCGLVPDWELSVRSFMMLRTDQ